jgi:hypothetical protein
MAARLRSAGFKPGFEAEFTGRAQPTRRLGLYLLYAANLAAFKADLDAMGVYRRVGQYVFHNTFGQLS